MKARMTLTRSGSQWWTWRGGRRARHVDVRRCAIVVILPLVAACGPHRAADRELPGLDRSCLLVDRGSGRRRSGRSRSCRRTCASGARPRAPPSSSAIASWRGRASRNDPDAYTVAEQAAACLESMQPDDPAALLLRGHVLHQMHRFSEAEAIARRLVTHARVRPRLRAARRRADGAGPGDGGGDGVPEDDRPQAVLPVLYARGAPALAERRPRRRDRHDAGGGQGREPARSRIDRLGLLAARDVRAAAWPPGRRGAHGRRVAAVRARLRRRAARARPHPARAEEARRGRRRR